MQLSSIQPQKTVSHGIEEKGQFKIQESAKAFNVLIDKLYTNKILAVIRELSTNAYEAHQMVNKEKQPFSVTLPNHYNKNFIVRDYGPGLSHEDATNLYVTLFASSKDGSNVYGGAFGLGSKSPFAYTNQFSVTSYHKGKKRIYLISKNDYGQPEWSLASESDTTETGVEIKIPVKDGDIGLFKQNAEAVYSYFMTRPTVSGQNLSLKTLKEKVSGTNWKIVEAGYYDPAVAVMGNIAYPLHGYTGKNSNLINHAGLILYFNIGDLEPTPSREALSFNKHTTLKIEKALEVLITEYSKNSQDIIDKETCMYDALIRYHQLQRASSIPLSCKYQGKTIKVTLPLKFSYFSIYSGRKSLATVTYNQDIHAHENVKFYILDDCTYNQQRLKIDCAGCTAYGVKEDTPAAIKEFCDNFGIPDTRLVRVSSLPKPTITRNTSGGPSNAHKSKVHEFQYANYSNFQCWKDVNIDLSKDKGYYTLIFNNRIRIDKNPNKYIDAGKFGKVIKEVYGKEVPFYGIKEAVAPKIGSQLVDLVEELKTNISSKTQQYNKVIDARETLNSLHGLYYFTSNLNKLAAAKIPQDLQDMQTKLKDLKALESQWHTLYTTMLTLNQIVASTHTASVDKKFVSDYQALSKKYDLLNHIDLSSSPTELYFYINAK